MSCPLVHAQPQAEAGAGGNGNPFMLLGTVFPHGVCHNRPADGPDQKTKTVHDLAGIRSLASQTLMLREGDLANPAGATLWLCAQLAPTQFIPGQQAVQVAPVAYTGLTGPLSRGVRVWERDGFVATGPRPFKFTPV